ncbi:MAG: thiamine pyrophosphokinase, partial [Rubrimonas sp.]
DSAGDVDGWRAREDVEVLHIEEQETTDLEKCLYSVSAPFFFGVGFMGRRFDHSLAALHALARWHARPALLLAEEEVAFLCPPNWRIRLEAGARVSLFPLAPVRALGSTGLEWPLDGPIFAPGARIGTSNVAAADEVASRFSARAMVCLLERRFLGAALDSLLDAIPRPGRR